MRPLRVAQLLALLASSAFAQEPTRDGPFGIYQGMPLAEVKAFAPETHPLPGTFVYALPSVPIPSPDFSSYAVFATPTLGVCGIHAMTTKLQTDSHGLAIKERFDTLVGLLSDVYGKPEVFDILLPGSMWKDPQYWMMGLERKERSLDAIWKLKGDPRRIDSIGLSATAKSQTEGRILLKYEFENYGECVKQHDIAKKAVL